MTATSLKLVDNSEDQTGERITPEVVFLEAIRECCIALMEGWGVTAQLESKEHEVAAHVQHAGYAGLIGFGGSEMRGCLVLYLDEAVVVSTRPQTMGRVDNQDAALRDWTGELANQLLGRVKNSMLRYDIKIAMGVPTAISGMGYTLTSIGDMNPVRLRFSSKIGEISVLVNTRCRPGLRLAAPEEKESDPAAEGDMMLF